MKAKIDGAIERAGAPGSARTAAGRAASRRSPSSGSSSRASAGRRRSARRPAGSRAPTWIALQPVPTTATRLPGELDVVAPLRGVERRALEALEAGDRRHRRHRELAAGGEQHVGLVRRRRSSAAPTCRARRPSAPAAPRCRADPLEHPVAPRDVLEVGLDLGLGRVAARPARVRRERELVEVRGDVAGGAGIGVVVPDAADPLAALEDGDVLVAGAAQHGDGADAAEAAADDGDRELRMPVLVGNATPTR